MGRSGLEKLYLRYCYELGYLPRYRQNPTKLHVLLKEDLLKCEQYSEQAKLLSKYHVNTDEDLSFLMKKMESKIAELTADRNDLRNMIRRVKPEMDVDQGRAQIAELTAEIKELRRELRICGQVQERSGHVRDHLEIIHRDRLAERNR